MNLPPRGGKEGTYQIRSRKSWLRPSCLVGRPGLQRPAQRACHLSQSGTPLVQQVLRRHLRTRGSAA